MPDDRKAELVKVNLPNRQSFSPDATFYTGEAAGMKFGEGAPAFAAEVRSEGDYGPAGGARHLREDSRLFRGRDARSPKEAGNSF